MVTLLAIRRPGWARAGLGRLLLAAALVLLAAVTAARAVGLAQTPRRLAAHGERTWFGWAWHWPGADPLLANVEPRLLPGERIALVLPPRTRNLPWWRIRAEYHFAAQRVVAVTTRRGEDSVPAGATVVAVTWRGTARVIRPHERRRRP